MLDIKRTFLAFQPDSFLLSIFSKTINCWYEKMSSNHRVPIGVLSCSISSYNDYHISISYLLSDFEATLIGCLGGRWSFRNLKLKLYLNDFISHKKLDWWKISCRVITLVVKKRISNFHLISIVPLHVRLVFIIFR